MIGIGDYDGKSRNTRTVRTREDQVIFMGKKYRKDKRTGYYLCTTGARQRLHVAVWEERWGREVPRGCVVHHLDWDKNNNSADNLICLLVSEHEAVHHSPGGREFGYKCVGNRVNGLPADINKD